MVVRWDEGEPRSPFRIETRHSQTDSEEWKREPTSYRISDGRVGIERVPWKEGNCCRKGGDALQNRHSRGSKWKHDPVALRYSTLFRLQIPSHWVPGEQYFHLPTKFCEDSTVMNKERRAHTDQPTFAKRRQTHRIRHRPCHHTFCHQSPAICKKLETER